MTLLSRQTFAALLIALMSFGTLHAAAPDAPTDVRATLMDMGIIGYGIHISWNLPSSSDDADYFSLYKAVGKENDYSKFSKLKDLDVALLDSLKSPNTAGWSWLVKGLPTGEYSFYLTATNGDGTSGESQIVTIFFRSLPPIHFTTQPPKVGKPNVEYVYDADAQALAGGVVKFEALSLPQGATLDETTGVVKYTATTKGSVGFAIKAYLESDPSVSAVQQWSVMFGDSNVPNDCMVFYGTVKYENGDPVPEGKIFAAEYTAAGGRPNVAFYGRIDQNGNYIIPVKKEATFILDAVGQTFEPEYYQDVTDPMNATTFDVSCGDSIEVNFVVTKKAIKPSIRFTTTPPFKWDPNLEFEYDADAVATNNGAIKYSIQYPQSATIDETTGLVKYTYTPNSSGMVQFKITAYLDSDPNVGAVQQWAVRFGPDSSNNRRECVFFVGTVKDENGNAITEGIVYAQTPASGGILGQKFVGRINQNGAYQIITQKDGVFKLRAEGQTFVPEWYEDQTDMQNATEFNTSCLDTIRVDFVVSPVTMHTVGGMVYAADNNDPVQAKVYAYSTNSNAANVAFTDNTGNWSMDLPEGKTFYFRAEPLTNDFYPEYYDNASSPSQATGVLIDAPKTGIDFSLERKQVYQNGLSGTLLGDNNTGVPGVVAAYKIEARGSILYLRMMGKTVTDSSGNFTISNLEPGDYVVRAILVPQGYAPGYYKENAEAVMLWQDATQIAVSNSGVISGIDIQLRKVNGIRGNHRFHGVVRLRINGAQGGDAIPMEGVFVQLVDNDNNISGHAQTDAAGEFSMEGIAAGSYTLVADLPGYEAYLEEISIDFSGNDSFQRDIEMGAQSTTSVDDPAAVSAFNLSLYPNPATDIVNINIAGLKEMATLRVFNRLGAEVYSQELQVSQSGENVSFNTADLPAGTYYLSVTGANSTTVTMFNIVR
ncbi:MAG: hypothetical protein CL946_02160 [Ectothiorhodospiraceae bacterium]|nr:hypothetical protein [Ectothiorhodospiraceae bacterium]